MDTRPRSTTLPARPLALPNLLTYARIAAVPVVVALHVSGRRSWTAACGCAGSALAMFITAGITDMLDGYVART